MMRSKLDLMRETGIYMEGQQRFMVVLMKSNEMSLQKQYLDYDFRN